MEKKTTPSVKEEKKEKKGGALMFIIIIGLLALLTGFFGYQFYNTNTQLTAQIEVTDNVTKERDDYHLQLEEKLAELEAMKSDNEEMNQKIEALQEEIRSYQEKLKSYEALGSVEYMRGLAGAKYQLNKKIKELEAKIEELKQENIALAGENTKLKTNLNEANSQNQKLTTENADLAGKVSLGSVLKTYQLSVNGVKEKGDKDKITTKAKRANKIRTCFTLSENPITPKGKKDVYVRVVGPNDAVITDGGSMFYYNGSEIAYSFKREIDYNGNSQDICVKVAPNGEKFEPGKYSVEVYVDGNQIGNAKVELK